MSKEKAVCPKCGRVHLVTEDGFIVICNSGIRYYFKPKTDILIKCKRTCGYKGVWKVEPQQWSTSISRG